MKTHQCAQGSPEWIKLRLGIITASEMDSLVSPEGKIRTGQGVDAYLYRKVCERMIGPAVNVRSYAMEEGLTLEPEARQWYSFVHDVEVKTVGFCTTEDGSVGCSPDGLIAYEGGLEIKCLQPTNALACLLEGRIPKEYVVQVQTSLFVTGLKWWDFLSYSQQWPALVVRVKPDAELQEKISTAAKLFTQRVEEAVAKVKTLQPAIP